MTGWPVEEVVTIVVVSVLLNELGSALHRRESNHQKERWNQFNLSIGPRPCVGGTKWAVVVKSLNDNWLCKPAEVCRGHLSKCSRVYQHRNPLLLLGI